MMLDDASEHYYRRWTAKRSDARSTNTVKTPMRLGKARQGKARQNKTRLVTSMNCCSIGPIHSALPLGRCSTGRHILEKENKQDKANQKKKEQRNKQTSKQTHKTNEMKQRQNKHSISKRKPAANPRP